ncbi:MAG TPA: flagellar protein FlgN [Candidatus Bathyarchaeia archaeon]|nr:flagellar protein FlgN [Candidatus Bathyarchaeia archaeon]
MSRLTELYETLENLLNLHKALYTLANEKKPVLIRGDADGLTKLTHQEKKLIKAIETTEAIRMELVRQVMAEKGIALREGTVTELIKSLTSAEEKQRLSHYRDELLRVVTALREANDLNQQLLEQSLSFIERSLDLFMDAPEEDFFYKNPLQVGNAQVARSYINKKA